MAETIAKSNLNMVCVDASEHSKRAMDWYLSSLHHEGDDVGIIHVYCLPELPSFGFYTGGLVATNLYQEQIKESIDESKKVVEKYKALLDDKGIKAKVFCESMIDSVGNTVCEIAKKNNASTIVMGQRGLGAIRRTFLGSSSDYVLHHAHIPVAVVPPSQ